MAKVYDNATDLITFARLQSQNTTSGSSYLGSDGLLKFAAEDEPRIEYAADGSLKGLLIEEQRTNLVANSQLGGAVVGVVGSGGALPTGWSSVAFNTVEVMEIDTFQGVPRIRIKATCDHTGGGGPIYPRIEIGSYSPSASTTYNYSAWVMDGPDRSSIEADLLVPDGVGNFLSVDCSGATEMTQFSGSATTAAGATGTHTIRVAHRVLAGDVGVSDFYISMPQLEEGSFATSYIPTSGSQQTRSADVASIPVSAFGYNDQAGTWVVNWTNGPDVTDDQQYLLLITGPDGNLVYSNAGATSSYAYDGSNVLAHGSWVADQEQTIAVAMSPTEVSSSLDGAAVNSSAQNGNLTADRSRTVYLGDREASPRPLNGHIKSIQYYPRRLTNTQLQELTS